jgi:hypothetical protein
MDMLFPVARFDTCLVSVHGGKLSTSRHLTLAAAEETLPRIKFYRIKNVWFLHQRTSLKDSAYPADWCALFRKIIPSHFQTTQTPRALLG